MFVADVKCSQATCMQTVPNSRTGSAKASVSEAVVHTWHRTPVIRVRPKYNWNREDQREYLLIYSFKLKSAFTSRQFFSIL